MRGDMPMLILEIMYTEIIYIFHSLSSAAICCFVVTNVGQAETL